MSKEFNTLIEYIEKMQSRYFLAFSAFCLYEALREELAPNLVGQEVAEKNVEVFKTFNEVFGISKEAVRVYFFIELAKLFDVSDQSLHITKVINYTESNFSKLAVEDFIEYDQDREFISHLVENYHGVEHEDLIIIRSEVENNKDIIQKVKNYRDKYLAHDDINKDEIEINGEEIKKLFDLLKKILNIFSSKLISTTSMYDHVEEGAKWKTKMLFDFIKKYEPYRLKEINDEAAKELESYKTKSLTHKDRSCEK